MKKIIIISITFLLLFPVIAYAHPGSTRADRGHYDNQTGEYHYHHGYPAHFHENGLCPYDFDDQTDHSYNGSTNNTDYYAPGEYIYRPSPTSSNSGSFKISKEELDKILDECFPEERNQVDSNPNTFETVDIIEKTDEYIKYRNPNGTVITEYLMVESTENKNSLYKFLVTVFIVGLWGLYAYTAIRNEINFRKSIK